MDFSWLHYFDGFWFFPLFCLLMMVFMMFGCGAMVSRWRSGRCGGCHGAPEKGAPH